MVPGDLSKVQRAPVQCCDEIYLIPFAFNLRLSNKNTFKKQHIRPAAVNKALLKLQEINPHSEGV